MWALNYYLTQLSLGCQQTPRGLETRCGREGHTRPRGPSESPDGVDPNIRRTIKTQRDGHNSAVKIWSFCSVSSTLSHANLEQPFRNPCNKVRGKYNCKEVFLRLLSCVFIMRPLFMRLSMILCRCDAEWWCRWLSNTRITQISIKYPSFIYTQSNGQIRLFLTIWSRVGHLFAHSLNIKQFYLTQWWDPTRYILSGLDWTLEQWRWRAKPHSSEFRGLRFTIRWFNVIFDTGGAYPLQSYSWCILQLQTSGLRVKWLLGGFVGSISVR